MTTMTLRSQLQQSDVMLVDLSAEDRFGPEAIEEREAGWLLSDHLRFARNWGRGWAWRESPRAARARNESAEPPAPTDAYSHALRTLAFGRDAARLPLAEEAEASRSTLLLPPKVVRCSEDVSLCVARLLEARDRLEERFLFAVCTLLAEMAQNVCEHSGSPGTVAVSWAPEGEGREGALCIAIVDAGIGIPISMARRFRDRGRAAPGPARAVRVALKLDTWPERQRGTGLCMSRGLVERYHGALHVRSGAVVMSAGPGGYLLSSRCPRRFAAIPGTQICIRLRPGAGARQPVGHICSGESVDSGLEKAVNCL
jgi:anti-sigma regulatory factor (Ser/Thr protein kinase)